MAVEPPGAPSTPPPGAAPGDDALAVLWARLVRPIDLVPAVAAVVGLPRRDVRQLVGTALAGSTEADELVAEFPRTVRSLATSVDAGAERCVGALRGPVLWSETLSARSASFGDPDVFVCTTAARAFDVDENRVLVHALAEVAQAAGEAMRSAGTHGDVTALHRARRNGADASRFLAHPALRTVRRARPTARALKRTRSSRHRARYAPALRLLERARTPLGLDEIRSLLDERTRAQHAVLAGVVHRLERAGHALPSFHVEEQELVAGPVRYRHARHLGDRWSPAGVLVGGLLVDVPDRLHDPNRRRAHDVMQARGGGRRTVVVYDERDLDRAVELAMELGLG